MRSTKRPGEPVAFTVFGLFPGIALLRCSCFRGGFPAAGLEPGIRMQKRGGRPAPRKECPPKK